jgi:hypothetical protein
VTQDDCKDCYAGPPNLLEVEPLRVKTGWRTD